VDLRREISSLSRTADEQQRVVSLQRMEIANLRTIQMPKTLPTSSNASLKR